MPFHIAALVPGDEPGSVTSARINLGEQFGE
jgi:hypothetical protein